MPCLITSVAVPYPCPLSGQWRALHALLVASWTVLSLLFTEMTGNNTECLQEEVLT